MVTTQRQTRDLLRRVRALVEPPSTVRDPRPWYNVVRGVLDDPDDEGGSGDADEATVYLYDEISWFWGVTADDFAREVAALDVDRINLRLNSPGGDVFDGVAIYNLLRSHRAEVHVIVDGLAASIASVIAMAGDTITMGAGTQMMIHNPHGIAIGGSGEMRAFADLLDRTAGEIAGFYQRRAGGEAANWLAAMDAETWYTGPEAVAAGLADAAEGTATDEAVADYRKFDLRARGFRYAGRDTAPAPSTLDRSAALRARHRARTNGGK